jgi:hypothetical protein
LLDKHGTVIVEGVVSDPTVIAAEFHGTKHTEGELLEGSISSFVLRVPYDESMVSINLFKYNPGSDLGMVKSKSSSGAIYDKKTLLQDAPLGIFYLN